MFTGPERAELEEVAVDPADLRPGEVLVRAEHSVVSAGTEGSFYTNLMAEVPQVYRPRPTIYPARTGYGHLGVVEALGPEAEEGGARPLYPLRPGQRVLSFSRHASVVRCNARRFALPVPPDADGTAGRLHPHGRGGHHRPAGQHGQRRGQRRHHRPGPGGQPGGAAVPDSPAAG